MDISTLATDDAVLRELGSRLRRLRLERDLSQAGLAEEAGVSRETVGRMESGESTQLGSLLRVLRTLDLLGGLERLVPSQPPSPIEALKRERPRRRASPGKSRPTDRPSPSWRWGDEPDEGDP